MVDLEIRDVRRRLAVDTHATTVREELLQGRLWDSRAVWLHGGSGHRHRDGADSLAAERNLDSFTQQLQVPSVMGRCVHTLLVPLEILDRMEAPHSDAWHDPAAV